MKHEYLDQMNRNVDNWRGPFYYNPKDPRVFVPKFTKWMGYTLNFANPYSWLVLVALIAGIIGLAITFK